MKILLYILLVSCVSVRSAFHLSVVYPSLNGRIIGVPLLLGEVCSILLDIRLQTAPLYVVEYN